MSQLDAGAGYQLQRGRIPLLVSMPHVGTALPEALRPRLRLQALACEDTDWHLPQVYDFARDLGASTLVAHWSRTVVDLNRPPDDAPMYPGANNTGLCPTRAFSGEALYLDGAEPDAAEVAQRRERYWRPYHDALSAELARMRHEFGHAVLFDAHSIRSHLPWLFEGKLPDLNLGTADATSCDPDLRARLVDVLQSQDRFSVAIDGRFRGGYITRKYGRPREACSAVQLEMCWSCYMDEAPPWVVDEARALRLRPVLESLLAGIATWRPAAAR